MSNRKMDSNKVEAFAIRYRMVYAHASEIFHAAADFQDARAAGRDSQTERAMSRLDEAADAACFDVEWQGDTPVLHGDPLYRKEGERDIRILDLL